MLRPALESDIPAMVAIGKNFINSTGLHLIAPYCEKHARRTLITMIRSKDAFVKVLDLNGAIEGFCGGRFGHTVFSSQIKTGQEDFMWVEPAYRQGWGAKMIEAMEEEAIAAGCASWCMICLHQERHELLDRLYKRKGYKLVEYRYIKDLT